MARKKNCCGDPPQDVPGWFMTYSDVITLMMTFFILLLTFATNEPEQFTRMQVAMFGGGMSPGTAGKNPDVLDNDSLLVRVRPKSARLTHRGSEMPPLDSDPQYQSLGLGIEALDQPHELADEQRLSIELPLSVMVDLQGEVTSLGHQQLRMLTAQMQRMPMDVRLEVSHPQDVDRSLQLARELISRGKVAAGRVAVGSGVSSVKPGALRLSLIRTKAGD